ncbi:glycosyltransferase [Chlorogloeopsis sp. ULAP01]|uniref:glycosyltransferase family 2 protein n=1 Tax=Chlorogloeopsis sp. ULAP01 TaxID=3056483 RepID=UPI0025AADC9C|nr:glycosyltransferase [Chlorogloeopsis sp. ULAP01]MDM9384194.1 glycosyltransferase [Chlorogloeopsis sp. ULAP01]
MNLSVIIACYNAGDTIVMQLEALAQQKWSEPWEIIFADNGSTDETIASIEKFQNKIPNLRLVDASKKRGAAHARNVGVSIAKGKALAFCDADDIIAPSWVAAMGEALKKYDFVAGQKDYKKLNEPWVFECFGIQETGLHEAAGYLPFAGANNLGVKRSIHEAIGGFDESILGIEDVDYCWRIQQSGTKLHYIPEALIYFRFRHTLKGMYLRSWNMGCQEPLLYRKHLPKGMPRLITWKTFVKAAVVLPLHLLLKVRDKKSLGRWLMDFAWRTGQFKGCIQYGYNPFTQLNFG